MFRKLAKFIGLTLPLVAGVLLSGCFTLPDPFYHMGPAFQKVDMIPSNRGLVYIYRPAEFLGVMVEFNMRMGRVVAIDDLKKKIGPGDSITILDVDIYDARLMPQESWCNNWGWEGSGGPGAVEFGMTNLKVRYIFKTALQPAGLILTDRYETLKSIEYPSDPTNFDLIFRRYVQQAARKNLPILLNVEYVIRVLNGGYYPRFIEPGEVVFLSHVEDDDSIMFNVKAGQVYYIKVSTNYRPYFTEVPKEIGEKEIAGCKLISHRK